MKHPTYIRTVPVSTKHFSSNDYVQFVNFFLLAAAFIGTVLDGAVTTAFLVIVLGGAAAILIQQI
jgi:hypothetical protein